MTTIECLAVQIDNTESDAYSRLTFTFLQDGRRRKVVERETPVSSNTEAQRIRLARLFMQRLRDTEHPPRPKGF